MGNDTKVLGKIRIGALQGGAFTPSALSGQNADLNLYGLPLVFESEQEAAYLWVWEWETLSAAISYELA